MRSRLNGLAAIGSALLDEVWRVTRRAPRDYPGQYVFGVAAKPATVSAARSASTRAMSVGQKLATHHPSTGGKLISMGQRLSQSASTAAAVATAAAKPAATVKPAAPTPAAAQPASFALRALTPAARPVAPAVAVAPAILRTPFNIATRPAAAPVSSRGGHIFMGQMAPPHVSISTAQQLIQTAQAAQAPTPPPGTDDAGLSSQVSYVGLATTAGDVINQIQPLIDQLNQVGSMTLAQSGQAIVDRAQAVVDTATQIHEAALAAHRAM